MKFENRIKHFLQFFSLSLLLVSHSESGLPYTLTLSKTVYTFLDKSDYLRTGTMTNTEKGYD